MSTRTSTSLRHAALVLDSLAPVAPARVLDIGLVCGRLGLSGHQLREAIGPADGPSATFEAIDIPENVSATHHRALYDRVHVGPASEALAAGNGSWDVIILNTSYARPHPEIVESCLDRADYVLLTGELRPNSGMTGMPGRTANLVRHAVTDARDAEAALLSRSDPRHVGDFPGADTSLASTRDELELLLDRAADQAFELGFIKRTRAYRMAKRFRESSLGLALARRKPDCVLVEALGESGDAAKGTEVWLLHASGKPGQPCVPWDFVVHDGAWETKTEPRRPHGRCMVTHRAAKLAVRIGPDPELKLLRHPWSGKVRITHAGRSETIDLYHSTGDVLSVFPARSPMRPRNGAVVSSSSPADSGEVAAPAPFTPYQQQFIEAVRKAAPPAIAVTIPRYLGVTSSTANLFEHCYFAPESRDVDPASLTEDDLWRHAETLLACRVPRIIFSGGHESQHRLVQLIREREPKVRCDVFLHYSYPQFSEDHGWALMKLWIDSARRGEVYSIASAKAGFDRFVKSLGVRGHVLLNRVGGKLLDPTMLPDSPREVGMWLSGSTYRKIPHAMLAALAMMPEVRLHGAGLCHRAMEVIEYLRLRTAGVQEAQISHDELFPRIRLTHLTMYVTFIECCPMIPLESLHHGVPALIGPNSHLFRDNVFLFERLVVPFPDHAEVIADYAERAIRERHAIVAEYRRYYPQYEARAREAFEAFIRG